MSLKKVLKRYLVIMIISSLVVSALIGIVVLLVGSFGDIEGRILLTTLVVGIFSITGLSSLRNIESPNRAYAIFAFAGVMLSIATLLLVVSIIWFDYSSFPWRLTLVLIVLSISSAHISLLLPSVSVINKGVRMLLWSTVACIVAVSAIIIDLIFSEYPYANELAIRVLGVFAILDVLGTIISPIASKLLARKSL